MRAPSLSSVVTLAVILSGGCESATPARSPSREAWGANRGGQLGNGTLQGSASPVPITGDFKFAAISAATNYSCGITTTRVIYGWGTDSYGYGVLGTGDAPQITRHAVPTKVLGQP